MYPEFSWKFSRNNNFKSRVNLFLIVKANLDFNFLSVQTNLGNVYWISQSTVLGYLLLSLCDVSFNIVNFDIQAKYKVYKSDRFSTEEHVLPTCSYRMGTMDMGFGVAILSKYWLNLRLELLSMENQLAC